MLPHQFKGLLQLFRFNDRQRLDKSDRLAPIRFILERFVKQLSQHFTQ